MVSAVASAVVSAMLILDILDLKWADDGIV
jgi:hypothetical protein